MKSFLEKNHVWIIVLLVIVVLYLVFTRSVAEPVSTAYLKKNWEAQKKTLTTAIAESQKIEKKMHLEIAGKEKKIVELSAALRSKMEEYQALKGRVSERVAEAGGFGDLAQCQREYRELVGRFNLSLAANERGESALGLCIEKSRTQEEVLRLQEVKYDECRLQLGLMEQKELAAEKALKEMENIYKRKVIKKEILKYSLGVVVAVAAGYWLAKKKQ